MKIAVIGPMTDGTGYSNAVIGYALALDAVGFDVVCRPAKMTESFGEVPQRIKELMDNDSNNVDAIFQYNLPSAFSYRSDVLNIGGFCYETDTIKYSGWIRPLSWMDLIVLPCKHQDNIIKDCMPGKKTVVVPCPEWHDTNNVNLGLIDNYPYTFYTIGEWVRRKDIERLVRAYLIEFDNRDNVQLVIKTSMVNMKGADVMGQATAIIDRIRKTVDKWASNVNFPPIRLCVNRLSDEEISSLHNESDCFVTVSRGESLCYPAVDAMRYGNRIIVPSHTCFLDYQYDKMHYVKWVPEYVTNAGNNGPLYTSRETWCTIDDINLMATMRAVYNIGKDKNKSINQHVVDMYGKQRLGNILKEAIENVNS